MKFVQLRMAFGDLRKGRKPGKLRSPRWPAVREAHLKENGECAVCGCKTDLEVHHIKQFNLYPSLELARDNLITLCDGPNSCHRTWGHFFSWTSINPDVVADAAAWRARVKNRPK